VESPAGTGNRIFRPDALQDIDEFIAEAVAAERRS